MKNKLFRKMILKIILIIHLHNTREIMISNDFQVIN